MVSCDWLVGVKHNSQYENTLVYINRLPMNTQQSSCKPKMPDDAFHCVFLTNNLGYSSNKLNYETKPIKTTRKT